MGLRAGRAGTFIVALGAAAFTSHDGIAGIASLAPIPTLVRQCASYAEAASVKDADPLCKVCPCLISPSRSPSTVAVELLVDTSNSVRDVRVGGKVSNGAIIETWAERAEAVLSQRLPGTKPRRTCIPDDCTVAVKAPRASDLAGALRQAATQAGSTTPTLVVLVSDGRQWTPNPLGAKANHCSKPARAQLGAAVKALVANPNVRLVMLILDGTGCDALQNVAKSSDPLCPSPDRCSEKALTLPLTPQQESSLLADLDERVQTQIAAFPHTLVKTSPDPRFPDAVLIGNDRRFQCSGVVIDDRTAITAAHCLPVTKLFATLDENEGGAPYAVTTAARHPDDRLDVALVRTRQAMPIPPRPRRRGKDDEPPTGLLRHVGFGATDTLGALGFGRKKHLDLMSSGWGCDGARAALSGCRPGWEMIVPGGAGGDTCSGDSGGPLYELIGDKGTCFFRLVAVTSRRVKDASAPCGSGGIYTRVDTVDDWITSQIARWDDEDKKRREAR